MRHLQPHMSNDFLNLRTLIGLSLDIILCSLQGEAKRLKLRDDSSKFFLFAYIPFCFFIGAPTETICVNVFFSRARYVSIILFLHFMDPSKRHSIRVLSEQPL